MRSSSNDRLGDHRRGRPRTSCGRGTSRHDRTVFCRCRDEDAPHRPSDPDAASHLHDHGQMRRSGRRTDLGQMRRSGRRTDLGQPRRSDHPHDHGQVRRSDHPHDHGQVRRSDRRLLAATDCRSAARPMTGAHHSTADRLPADGHHLTGDHHLATGNHHSSGDHHLADGHHPTGDHQPATEHHHSSADRLLADGHHPTGDHQPATEHHHSSEGHHPCGHRRPGETRCRTADGRRPANADPPVARQRRRRNGPHLCDQDRPSRGTARRTSAGGRRPGVGGRTADVAGRRRGHPPAHRDPRLSDQANRWSSGPLAGPRHAAGAPQRRRPDRRPNATANVRCHPSRRSGADRPRTRTRRSIPSCVEVHPNHARPRAERNGAAEELDGLVLRPRTHLTSNGRPRCRTASGREDGRKTKRAPCACAGGSPSEIRRRPTLPGGLPPSTIGAGRLNFRVRDGNGCDSAAMATGNLLSIVGVTRRRAATRPPSRTPEQARAMFKPSPRPISTGRLNTSPCLHLRPINVVVWPRALPG